MRAKRHPAVAVFFTKQELDNVYKRGMAEGAKRERARIRKALQNFENPMRLPGLDTLVNSVIHLIDGRAKPVRRKK